MSSSEKDLVQESVREFFEGLHSLVPLRHFSEYHEEDMIRKAAQEESNKVLNNFIRKTEALNDLRVKGVLLKELCLELEKVIEEHLKKNQEYKAKAESFLKKRTDDLCEDFKGTYEAKLLLSPDMNLKSVEELLENGKLLALCYFENHSNFGNADIYEEHKRRLQGKLEVMCKEMLEKHGHLLEIKARKSLKDIKNVVRNMSGEIQRDINTLDGLVSGNLRKASLVFDYFSETRNSINEKCPRVQEELCETLEAVMKYLSEAKENMHTSLEDGIGWARRLDQQLHAYFFANEDGFESVMEQENDELETSYGSISNADDADKVQAKDSTVQKGEPTVTSGELTMERVKHDCKSSQDVKSLNEQLFLRAILDGQSVAIIQKILDDGANVNIKTTNGNTAAHFIVSSLIDKTITSKEACPILNLIVANGFNLINERNKRGLTPLFLLMQYVDLNEELLKWLFDHGADFSAVLDSISILLQAVANRQGARIICKILEFGANPKHLTKFKANALHIAAATANESALEIFMDKLDLNAMAVGGYTPLHYLFSKDDLDYLPCLEILLRKGANFNAKSNVGDVPLVMWMMYSERIRRNPFPALMKVKGMLPISEEIASATLSVILREMDCLKKLLPERCKDQNEFSQFITFLIEEKKAKLRWNDTDECQWALQDWRTLEKDLVSCDFARKLEIYNCSKLDGEIVEINATVLGKLDFHSNSSSVTIPIEVVITCLLACANYLGLVKLCKCLKSFTGHVVPK